MSLNAKKYHITNRIEPHAFISPSVKMGDHNYIGVGVIIQGDVEIGNYNIIAPYSIIGGPAEHTVSNLHWDEIEEGMVIIGDRNIIREFVTIHQPHSDKTIIGNDCFLMCHSHIGHDAKIGNGVVLSPYASIGGYSIVMKNSYIGMKATLHQNTTIGNCVMVGMGSVVVKDIPPFFTIAGNPAKFMQFNNIGMLRHGYSEEDVALINDTFFDPGTTANTFLRVAYQDFAHNREKNKSRKLL